MNTSGLITELVLSGTLRLTIAAALAFGLLWFAQVRVAKLHRWIWSAVLIQSLLLAPLAIPLPVLEPRAGDTSVEPVPVVSTGITERSSSGVMELAHESGTVHRSSTISLLGIIWVLGLAVVLSLFALSQLVVQWTMRRAVPARAAWRAQLSDVRRKCGVKRPVELLVASNWGPLLTWSTRGYRIVVPRCQWEALTVEQREAVLMHELAHLRRGDLRWSLLMRLAASCHWFNPLAWWIVARFDEAAEWACDGEVRRVSEYHGASLAGALLSFSGPKPMFRLGVSMARGAKVSLRVRRLIDSRSTEDSKMKTALIGGIAILIFVTGLLRFELIAQEMNRNDTGSRSISPEIAQLASRLAVSDDELQQQLASALQTRAGQLVLSDVLRRRAALDSRSGSDPVDQVLRKHFTIDANSARLTDVSDPLRSELIEAAQQSNQDITQLSAVCRSISSQLQGDDETTRLVKRFLEQEAGPTMFYIKQLRGRMRPGPEMMSMTFGRLLAHDAAGRFHVRPDAREQVRQLLSLQEPAMQRVGQLAAELKSWVGELEEADELHSRLKRDVCEPLFAARIVAEAVFQHHDLGRVSVRDMLDHLDTLVVVTSRGIRLTDEAHDEVRRVLDKYESVRDRAEKLREAVNAFQDRIADDDETSRDFKLLLKTDIGLLAVAMNSNTVDVPVDELVRGIMSESFEESENGLRIRADAEQQERISRRIQEAYREFRQMHRRAAPVREIGDKLEDAELADALKSVGGMLVIRRQVEMAAADTRAESMKDWESEIFFSGTNGLRIRDESRSQVEQFLSMVDRTGEELQRDDF